MHKLLSLIIFIAALAWSWNIVHSTPAIGFETHSGIQQKLAQLIQDTIQIKKPNAQDMQITRLWTEALEENKVRAVFAYKFKETEAGGSMTEQTIEGDAILHREPSDDNKVDKWVVQQVRTTNDNVIFKNDTLVTPTPGTDEEPPAETPAPPAVKETKSHE